MSKNNFESAFAALPFKKLHIEEEKEEPAIQFEAEEDEYLKQPAALIIPLNIPNLSEEPAPETQNNTDNQQISLPLIFAPNMFNTLVIEKEEGEEPKSPGVASLEIEDESENQSQNHKSYAPSPQVSGGSPFNPEKANKKQGSALKQPHCFLNFEIASDKELEAESQTESGSEKQELSLGGQKDKNEGKENLQNSTNSSKKQISPFICVKTLLMKKSPFMHLKKQMQKNNQKHTHMNMQMLAGDSTKSGEPPSGPQLDDAEM